MYRYEPHLHTAPVSRCASASVEEALRFYREIGYDGVFITNHFIDGNIGLPHEMSYAEKIRYYFSAYREGLVLSGEIGIKVFCGVESSYGGTDFLIYGLDEAWFLAHEEWVDMPKSEQLALFARHGAMIIQAHPFREAGYIDHIRLFPRQIEGVEVLNSARSEAENRMAECYAAHYGLLRTAGSDFHSLNDRFRPLAGVETEEPLESVEDYMAAVRSGRTKIFERR